MRIVNAGIEPSIGGINHSYDPSLAETVIGLFKTKAVARAGP